MVSPRSPSHKRDTPLDISTLQKNPDFYARYMQVWCWTCGRVTRHEITFRWGGRCFLCKECGNIVVEKL